MIQWSSNRIWTVRKLYNDQFGFITRENSRNFCERLKFVFIQLITSHAVQRARTRFNTWMTSGKVSKQVIRKFSKQANNCDRRINWLKTHNYITYLYNREKIIRDPNLLHCDSRLVIYSHELLLRSHHVFECHNQCVLRFNGSPIPGNYMYNSFLFWNSWRKLL